MRKPASANTIIIYYNYVRFLDFYTYIRNLRGNGIAF